ncbi:hypothetical protein LINGRAHAP2_LOCUS23023 [Linum grandiflorum]
MPSWIGKNWVRPTLIERSKI